MSKDLTVQPAQQIATQEPRSLLEAVMAQVSNPDMDPERSGILR